MASFACIWNAVGIDLGWLFLVMGLIIGGAVFPAAFTVVWKAQTRAGAVSGCLAGLAAGVTAWLVEAKVYYGELTIETTGASYPTLAGNMASLLTGLIVTVGLSLAKPDDFDWAVTRAINADASNAVATVLPSPESSEPTDTNKEKGMTAEDSGPVTDRDEPPSPQSPGNGVDPGQNAKADKEAMQDNEFLENPVALRKAYILALILSIVLTLLMDFVIPMPMFFSRYLFSEQFFTGWVIISFLWVFASLLIRGVLPVWETRAFWMALGREIFSRKKGSRAR